MKARVEGRVLGIDPGTLASGWAVWDGSLVAHGNSENRFLVSEIAAALPGPTNAVAIEMIGNYGTGMPAGKTTFHTCLWIGVFMRDFKELWGAQPSLVLRPSVKAAVCGNPRAKDGNVIQALKDQIGDKGTKGAPGPLFGISSHAWQALALAYAFKNGGISTVEDFVL